VSKEPAHVVRAFYDAVAARDSNGLSEIVKNSFHADASISWPEGLPYGGRVEGASRLSRLFVGMASSPVPVGPSGLEVVSIVDGGGMVAAQLEFSWHAPGSTDSIPSGALELWTFDQGLVSEIRAYYWDTAACRDLVKDTQAASADA